jgi:hypothetical protein
MSFDFCVLTVTHSDHVVISGTWSLQVCESNEGNGHQNLCEAVIEVYDFDESL